MSFAAELTLEDALSLVRVTRAGAEQMLGISPEALLQLEAAGVVEFSAEDGQCAITSLVGGMFVEACKIGVQAADVAEGARTMALEASTLISDFLKRLEEEPAIIATSALPDMFVKLAAIFEEAAPRIYAPIGSPPKKGE